MHAGQARHVVPRKAWKGGSIIPLTHSGTDTRTSCFIIGRCAAPPILADTGTKSLCSKLEQTSNRNFIDPLRGKADKARGLPAIIAHNRRDDI